MADNPQSYGRVAARPVPYTTAIARAMNMQAIVNGWLPEVRGWHCTVSDQFMQVTDGAPTVPGAGTLLDGGKASPTIMRFPITYEGVWTEQFGLGTYFGSPAAGTKTYTRGPSQPDPVPFPAGYRGRVGMVRAEVSWVTQPANLYDPADWCRWFWLEDGVKVPGWTGTCASRTSLGTNAVFGVPDITYNQLYFYPQANMPPIFLTPGKTYHLQVEHYTLNNSMSTALSISASGVMWPIGLEGS